MAGDKIGALAGAVRRRAGAAQAVVDPRAHSLATARSRKLKAKLRENRLVTVCEEASCPNIHECFSHGTATFMILGEVCTRRCSFCDVAHGRPEAARCRRAAATWPPPSPTWA